MRTLQRAAEKALEKTAQGQERVRQAGEDGTVSERAGTGPDLTEGRSERLLSGLERELTRRLKSVLERLDLPSRRELEALDERIRKLEKTLTREASPRRPAKRKTLRRKPPNT